MPVEAETNIETASNRRGWLKPLPGAIALGCTLIVLAVLSLVRHQHIPALALHVERYWFIGWLGYCLVAWVVWRSLPLRFFRPQRPKYNPELSMLQILAVIVSLVGFVCVLALADHLASLLKSRVAKEILTDNAWFLVWVFFFGLGDHYWRRVLEPGKTKQRQDATG